MTTTALDRQPSTPGDLREDVAYLVYRAVDIGDPSRAAALEVADQIMIRWADELDAAPATYSLPAEPPEHVTELWDQDSRRWVKAGPALAGGWSHWEVPGDEHRTFQPYYALLGRHGPLSAVPPERTEAGDA